MATTLIKLKRRAPAYLLGCVTGCGQFFSPDAASSSGATPSPGDIVAAQACLEGRGGVPNAAPLRRLSSREYAITIKQITGVDPTPFMTGFPSDAKVKGLFDIEVEQQQITNTLSAGFRTVAHKVSQQAIAAGSRAAFVGCEPSGETRESCLKSFVDRFVGRAWRRSLAKEEHDDILALANMESDGFKAVGLIVYAVLQSPSFLYRPEFGTGSANVERPLLAQLAPNEVATRLAFLIWGETPDAAVIGPSMATRLATADGVRAVATEMLKDERATRQIRELFRQWFGLNKLTAQSRSADRYPSFSLDLLRSMEAEVSTMTVNNGWAPGSSFLNLFNTNSTFIDRGLAELYGASVSSNTPVAFDLGSLPDRGGIFSTAGILTVSGTNRDNPSIVGRGVWVKENVFCESTLPPPPGTEIVAPNPQASAAEAADKHQADPVCKGCHLQIDPIGRGLERYDAIGSVRTAYPNGKPLPTDGALPVFENRPFGGGRQLGELARQSEKAQVCVTEHVWRWMFARKADRNVVLDDCTLRSFHDAMRKTNYNIHDAIAQYVSSDAFRFRAPVVD